MCAMSRTWGNKGRCEPGGASRGWLPGEFGLGSEDEVLGLPLGLSPGLCRTGCFAFRAVTPETGLAVPLGLQAVAVADAAYGDARPLPFGCHVPASVVPVSKL